MRDYLAGILGMILPGGFSLYTIVEKLNPFLQFAGLVLTITIGITVLIINRNKIAQQEREKQIDEIILRHKDD